MCRDKGKEMPKTYSDCERSYGEGHNRRCIDGRMTGSGKCVGYCRYDGHPGFLTREQRKEHNCIQKECFYYLPKVKAASEQPQVSWKAGLLCWLEMKTAVSYTE